MLHPVLAQKRLFYGFMAGWITLFLGHTLFLFYEYLPFNQAAVDAFIYNGVFMILSVALYFPLAYPEDCAPSDFTKKSFIYHAFHNIATGLVTVTIWLGASFFITSQLLIQSTDYIDFARASLPMRAAFGGLLIVLLISMYHFISFYKHLEEKNTREEQLKKMLKEAELKALKAQLNPHFLFNSLNSISSLTISDPEGAREMLTLLSDFLRYSLKKKEETLLPLKEEIKNIQRYLEIEKVRFGDRLNCDFSIQPDCAEMPVPAMLLQPLYENAIKHGLYESIEPVFIKTHCKASHNKLEISVSNNFDPDSTPVKGEGVGLENIQNKLLLFYNRTDLMTIKRENNTFEIKISIPKPPKK
ncbi:sensor histidine kinase [Marinilabilia sp.]|uniref:sensor histidine kinase n=1 Tax=Marinilabilia sp. TaxID=2021252 RepID=UPI0025C23D73|nr:histidine kinase [Marinilabilia sp.]